MLPEERLKERSFPLHSGYTFGGWIESSVVAAVLKSSHRPTRSLAMSRLSWIRPFEGIW